MEMQVKKLSDVPEIKELLRVLQENGLLKEESEVKSLVDYIEAMETKLGDMSQELSDMHLQVKDIRDHTIRAKCTELLGKAEETLKQAKQAVVSCKNNLIASAKSALTAFKEKGKGALVSAVNAMKIPSALEHLKNGFQKASESMRAHAGKLDAVREELHGVGVHLKNAGRALLGKPTKESDQLKADKGVLAKLRNLLQKSASGLESMGNDAASLSTRLRESHERRQSVKSDLNDLKAVRHDKGTPPLAKEVAR